MTKYNYGFFDGIDYSKELSIDPRQVMNQEGVDDILNQVLQGATRAEIENQHLLKQLMQIDALTSSEKLQIAFPLFTLPDFMKLQQAVKPAINEVVEVIKRHRGQILNSLSYLDSRFPPEHHAYFVLCAGLFDGHIFDVFAERKIITLHKKHQNGLDYIIFGHEQHPYIEKESSSKLCSYNRCGHFVSFGNGIGDRLDVYRARMRISNTNTPSLFQEIATICQNAHWEPRLLGDYLNKAIEDLRTGKKIDPVAQQLLEIFDYVRDQDIIVPVYDNIEEVICRMAKPFLDDIVNIFANIVQNMDQLLEGTHLKDFVCLPQDIANDLWHLIFGEVNEELVRLGIVKRPNSYPGQGRYLKCLEF